jgi:hypothetical protein
MVFDAVVAVFELFEKQRTHHCGIVWIAVRRRIANIRKADFNDLMLYNKIRVKCSIISRSSSMYIYIYINCTIVMRAIRQLENAVIIDVRFICIMQLYAVQVILNRLKPFGRLQYKVGQTSTGMPEHRRRMHIISFTVRDLYHRGVLTGIRDILWFESYLGQIKSVVSVLHLISLPDRVPVRLLAFLRVLT